MQPFEKPIEQILRDLQERAKELECLYRIEEILKHDDRTLDETVVAILEAIPQGWQYPATCQARITLEDVTYQSLGFKESMWVQCATINVQRETAGCLEVSYRDSAPPADEGPFLSEERRLIDAIADRIGHFLERQKLEQAFVELELARRTAARGGPPQWGVIVDFLRRTDRGLLTRISRKMLNHLSWSGFEDASALMERLAPPSVRRRRDGGGEPPAEPPPRARLPEGCGRNVSHRGEPSGRAGDRLVHPALDS